MNTDTKLKPRVLWANYHKKCCACHSTRAHAIAGSLNRKHVKTAIRVAVIPLDDVEAIAEKAYSAYWANWHHGDHGRLRAALTAAGIPCKRKASK